MGRLPEVQDETTVWLTQKTSNPNLYTLDEFMEMMNGLIRERLIATFSSDTIHIEDGLSQTASIVDNAYAAWNHFQR